MHNQDVEQLTFKLADSSLSQSLSLYMYMSILYAFMCIKVYGYPKVILKIPTNLHYFSQ